MKHIIVETTFDSESEAKRLAKMLIEQGLAACVSIYKACSVYRWEGKLEEADEFVLMAKTQKSLYKTVEKFIKQNHSYDLPQIIATKIVAGSKGYLNWIDSETERK